MENRLKPAPVKGSGLYVPMFQCSKLNIHIGKITPQKTRGGRGTPQFNSGVTPERPQATAGAGSRRFYGIHSGRRGGTVQNTVTIP